MVNSINIGKYSLCAPTSSSSATYTTTTYTTATYNAAAYAATYYSSVGEKYVIMKGCLNSQIG